MTQTKDLLTRFKNDVIEIEPTPRWLRVVFGGTIIADSKHVVILFEKGHTPAYYIPESDIRKDLMSPSDHSTHCPRKGDAAYYSITVGDRVTENALWYYPKPFASSADLADDDAPDLRGYVAFYWNKMDSWYEENEEVFVHARDPYKRVDVLSSTRHVQVVIGGETVAETHSPLLLFETGLPTRYYIPKLDVRQELLLPSDRSTSCPYKGNANYFSVATTDRVHEDIAWYYRHPALESAKVAGHIAFFNERVDAIIVDGEQQEKPKNKWSSK
jgi:uncharacterized protein (DUF427 family)